MSSETRPAVLRKLAYFHKTPHVATTTGIPLELLHRFVAGRAELTPEQLQKLSRVIAQRTNTQRYKS